MTPFMHGFVDELTKLAAFPQQHEQDPSYDSASPIASTLSQKKRVDPTATAAAPYKAAPTPMSTPSEMVGRTAPQ